MIDSCEHTECGLCEQCALQQSTIGERTVVGEVISGESQPPEVAPHKQMLTFCPRCFASSEDGSWGDVAIGDGCMNCGSGGTVVIPRWAVDSIREQASWVGKRYYPHAEDKEQVRELRYLRSIAPRIGFKVEAHRDEHDGVETYSVSRGGLSIFSFRSREEAEREGPLRLPYAVPQDFDR